MREIPISKFKATCLATLAEVRRTRVPVRITRFGKPVADVVPPKAPAKKKSWLGCMRDETEFVGDITNTADIWEPWEP
jgi:antitoxin (DNA-binding transcriptional repressor) of toxin-antitoxin stability system